MTLLNQEALAELALAHPGPCLSLYQPTHRSRPGNAQDPIRFRNLVKQLEVALLREHSSVETRMLLKPFEALARDSAFWNHTLDGLAVLSSSGLFRVFRLQRPVAELAVVADSFHTKPLRNFLQSVGRYQVLALSLSKVRLFEGNRDALDEIDPAPAIPRSIDEIQRGRPDGVDPAGVSLADIDTPEHHSHRGTRDEADIDAERFFRAIDHAVLEHHSRPSGLPLMLAALPQHHHLFRQISHNPFLVIEELNVNPDAMPVDELRRRAWEVIEPHYRAQLSSLAEEFSSAVSRGLGSADIVQVAEAAAVGRVDTLLIESDRQIAGSLDDATGHIHLTDSGMAKGDDLLDDLGELVVKTGGRVLVVPGDMMPARTGLSATYRY